MDIDVKTLRDGETVNLVISGSNLELSLERIEVLRKLIEVVLHADHKFQNLTSEAFSSRQSSILAMEMKLQAALIFAEQQASAYRAVVSGEESVANHGFPEFS